MPTGGGVNAFGRDLEERDERMFEAELSNRYSDDDSDGDAAAADAPKPQAPPPPPARVADGSPDAGDDVDDAYDVDAPADDGERGERGWADRMDEFPDDDGDEYAEADEEDDEDFYDEDDDDELAHALDSLDTRDDFEARGGHAGGGGGGLATSAWRPNANGGAGNHGRGARLPGGGKSRGGGSRSSSAVAKSSGKDNQTLMQHNSARIDKKIRTGYLHGDFGGGGNVGQRVGNAMRESERKLTKTGNLTKDKEDRATVEQALDPRTRLILFKMLSHGVFSEINGCISTGKEANVYHAVTAEGVDLAVKVYKTSILVFKDRDRYVSGDWRWRNGYSRKNPRKMVQTWAEKEMRNLIRLREAGMRVPEVRLLRSHVLVMSFVGDDGVAAPRLKDATLSNSKYRELFSELLVDVRRMYQDCRLVHADFSEYNILYHGGHAHIIDVSQSVDLDHPRCLDFLREDLLHLGQFFAKNGVAVPTVREMFDFVTDPAVTEQNVDACLEALNESAVARGVRRGRGDGGEGASEVGASTGAGMGSAKGARAADDGMVDEVFQQAFIPKRLDEVDTFERDQRRLRAGAGVSEGVYYQSITGMKDDMTGTESTPKILRAKAEAEGLGWAGMATTTSASARRREKREAEKNDGGEAEKDEDGEDGETSGSASSESDGFEEELDENGEPTRRRRIKAPVDKAAVRAARKENKKEVKAEAAERRKTKIKKHLKKKAVSKNKKK